MCQRGRFLRRNTLLAAPLLLASVFSSPLAAEVRLFSQDGRVDLRGVSVHLEQDTYFLMTGTRTLEVPAALVICEGRGCPRPADLEETETTASAEPGSFSDIRIVGAPSLLKGSVPEIIDAFSLALNTDIWRGLDEDGHVIFELQAGDGLALGNIRLEPDRRDEALQRLSNGQAQIAILYEAGYRERRQADQAEQGLKKQILARDAIMILAGARIPVQALPVVDLADILAGRITNWQDLGGPDLEIKVFGREPRSATSDLMESLLLRPRGLELGSHVIDLTSDRAVAEAVDRFPNSLGVIRYRPDLQARAMPVLDRCGHAVAPGIFSVKTEAYPLTARIVAFRSADAKDKGELERFSLFLVSRDTREVVAATGAVDNAPVQNELQTALTLIAEVSSSLDDQVRILAQERYRRVTNGARQLSLLFRNPGEHLHSEARFDPEIVALAEMIASNLKAIEDIFLIGLSSSRSDASEAMRASSGAADSVRKALMMIADDARAGYADRVSSAGYGDVTSRGCKKHAHGPSDLWVEVWVR